MKTLISLTLSLSIFFLGINAFGQGADYRSGILNWEPTLPVAEQAFSQLIQLKAYELFYVEGKERACGGEVLSSELVNYYTFLSEDTTMVHKLRVQVEITGSFNHCEKETLHVCSVPITMKSEKVFGMGKWECHLVDIED